jgi:Uma2 family endonuclease
MERHAMATELSTTPTLETGDNLTRDEFLRIWAQLPDIRRAELVGGIVYMPSPQRIEHSTTGRHISGWLAMYEARTPGCRGGDNATSLIGEDCPQPDGYLAILPECGGKSRGKKYLEGAPELIDEISYSTASIDLHQKYDLYEKAGVQEYLVILLKKREVRWHRLVNGKYKRLRPDATGVIRSRVFPGLWLDSKALFTNDLAGVLTTLEEGLACAEHGRFVADLAARRQR